MSTYLVAVVRLFDHIEGTPIDGMHVSMMIYCFILWN